MSEMQDEEDNIEQVSDDEQESSRDPTDLGDEISVDDLGIDLESLALPQNTGLLGRAKPRPALTENASDRRPVGRPSREDEGVFAWCEQFNYTPGVEFLKVNRIYPKVWEGVTIGGFIEEIYEPIDEHWLAERWGGGSYQLDAYQRDSTGRSRKTLTKFVEISGLPKAFMGADGRTHPLPSSTKNSITSSRRSSDVLRRRMGLGRFRDDDHDDDDDRGFGDQESVPRPRPPLRPTNLDQPIADASSIYKALQETKKSENEALGVLREAQKDVHSQMQATAVQQQEMYKTLLEQQKEEMRRLREESKHAAQTSSAPFKELLQFMATQGGSNTSRENLDVLRSAHETAINSLTREHTSHIEDIRKTYESRHIQLSDELNRLRAQFAQEVERVRADYLEKEKTSKDDAFRAYQSQLEIVRSQSGELRERHRDELATITREKNETIAQLRQELSELRTSLFSKDHETRMGALEKENALRREYADREKQLQDRITNLENSSRTALLERENAIRNEYSTREKILMDRISQLEISSKTTLLERENAIRIEYGEREKKLSEKINQLESGSKTSLVEERQRIREEFEERYEAKFKSAQDAFDAKMTTTIASAELKTSTAEKEAKALVESMRRELKSEYESKNARLEAQIESLKKEYESREKLAIERSQMERDVAQRDRENQRILMESNATSREMLGEMTRKQLEARVKELTKDLEQARQDQEVLAQQLIPESNDPFDQLEKLNKIKEKLKAHGFIDQADKKEDEDDEEEEEKPKDLIGKILHYGPQFVAPILQRIDAATAVAQQAVANQQEEQQQAQAQELLKTRQQLIEQQQAIEAERNAAIDRENSLRERREMLLQRRAQRDQELEYEAQARMQMAEQLQQTRTPPQPSPSPSPTPTSEQPIIEEWESPIQATKTEEEVTEMSEDSNDGYKKLAEYLNTAIKDKKSSQAIVREIKGALMLGMFSKETLDEILAKDFDELINTLSTYKSSLHSPKARVTLKSVMEGLKK